MQLVCLYKLSIDCVLTNKALLLVY
jgi:hypothetical protein